MTERIQARRITAALKMTLAGRFPIKRAWNDRVYVTRDYALHQHFYKGWAEIGGESFALQEGDYTVMAPGEPTRFIVEKDGWHWCIQFSQEKKTKGSPAGSVVIPRHTRGTLLLNNNALTRSAWWWQQSQTQHPFQKVSKQITANILFEMLATLALAKGEGHLPIGSKADRSARAAHWVRTAIQERFAEPLSVPQLANEAGVSERSLRRAFQEKYQLSVVEFLLKWRVEMGAQLLAGSNKTVKEVASSTGFQDQHYFNKQFRRLMGCAPSRWR